MLLSSQANAESFLCDATQASENQLPVLEQACPIGKGLWGSSEPKGHTQNDLFWVQCGLLAKPLSLEKAKPIYKNISTNVWMKPEAKGFRCLIGPYQTYSDAKKELMGVRNVEGYEEAFIRMVDKSAPKKSQVQPKSSAKPKVKAPVVTATASPKLYTDSKEAMKPKVEPKAANSVASISATPTLKAQMPKQGDGNINVQIRLQTNISGKTYSVPYLNDNEHQFYMEQGKPWSRLDYDGAKLVCYELGMGLATEEQWQRLLESKVMEKEDWPMHLPYWGLLKKGLFTNGNITQLKGSSLLNVLCVK
ncbi:SPOR domain-containing protein [Vibrio gallaecicus]